jgi:diaminopimelate decarboxylase
VAVLRAAARRDGLHISGIHLHVGSQIQKLDPLRRAAQLGVRLAADLRDAGVRIDHLDLGGGLGISYDGSPVPTLDEYARALLEVVRPSGVPLIVEPGRAIVGPAGVLVGRVVDVKPQGGGKHFVVLDSGMTELIRPALYGAFHRIVPAQVVDAPVVSCDVVGPLCETSDTLGADRELPLPEIDSLLAVLDAGAYGAVMGSNYNRRMLPPEVLVDGAEWRIIRRRQTIDDVLALET